MEDVTTRQQVHPAWGPDLHLANGTHLALAVAQQGAHRVHHRAQLDQPPTSEDHRGYVGEPDPVECQQGAKEGVDGQ